MYLLLQLFFALVFVMFSIVFGAVGFYLTRLNTSWTAAFYNSILVVTSNGPAIQGISYQQKVFMCVFASFNSCFNNIICIALFTTLATRLTNSIRNTQDVFLRHPTLSSLEKHPWVSILFSLMIAALLFLLLTILGAVGFYATSLSSTWTSAFYCSILMVTNNGPPYVALTSPEMIFTSFFALLNGCCASLVYMSIFTSVATIFVKQIEETQRNLATRLSNATFL